MECVSGEHEVNGGGPSAISFGDAGIVMGKTDVWRAVLNLAERLPTTGRMPGNTVVSIVQNALRAL